MHAASLWTAAWKRQNLLAGARLRFRVQSFVREGFLALSDSQASERAGGRRELWQAQ
jgi:hypothetical protein